MLIWWRIVILDDVWAEHVPVYYRQDCVFTTIVSPLSSAKTGGSGPLSPGRLNIPASIGSVQFSSHSASNLAGRQESLQATVELLTRQTLADNRLRETF